MPPPDMHDPVVALWTSAAWLELATAESAHECAALVVACERLRGRLGDAGVDLPPAVSPCGAAGVCPGDRGTTCDVPWPSVRRSA